MSASLVEATSGRESRADSELVIGVEGGFPGFPELSEFSIIPIDQYSMFVWLSAPAEQAATFLAVNPFLCFPDYAVEVSDMDEAILRVEPGDELIVYCLVSIDRQDGDTATANLVAPVVINMTRAVAQQVILEGDNQLRAPLPRPDLAEQP